MPNNVDDLSDLCERLGQLGQLFHEANRHLVEFLARRASQAPGDGVCEGAPHARDEKIDALTEAFGRLETRLEAGLRTLAEQCGPAAVAAPLASAATPAAPAVAAFDAPSVHADWHRAILGAALAERPQLDFQRQQLFDGLLSGDPAACGLVGQLLVFRAATADKMPVLLKEIGEAYYRWQPKSEPGAAAMEQALAEWLQGVCDAAGAPNTIELVHPGERFDAARHNAATRGVEITEVRGWIVLRDNGKVYTKATVVVR